MGRKLSFEEHLKVLEWGKTFKEISYFKIYTPLGKCIRREARRELDLYWNLAKLSRSHDQRLEMSLAAHRMIFKVRTILERGLAGLVRKEIAVGNLSTEDLFDGNFFGGSIKQGASLRMPLASCNPTPDCRGSCYAHDGMDAGRNPVVRGVLNGLIAEKYEHGNNLEQNKIRTFLIPHVRRVISTACSEAQKASFQRQPRIRFSHVGEITAFPKFANTLAKMVQDESKGEVVCVVYTRHPNAELLNPDLFVVLFSLDESSENRRRFIPPHARIVRSAFGGKITENVDINFLEHHRSFHSKPVGMGKVCPATAPETEVRTCDACKCDFCFRPKLAH